MPEGATGKRIVVEDAQRWSWTPLDEPGWPETGWIAEEFGSGDQHWYARINATQSDHPPLVLLHGLIVSGTYYRPLARHLDTDLKLYVPDLPGVGRSQPRGNTWTIAEHAAGLADWMESHGLHDAVLVGNSLGCQVVTQLAAQRPDLVRGMVLISPTMPPDARSIVQLAGRALLDVPRERLALWPIWITDFFRVGPVNALKSLHDGLKDDQLGRLPFVATPALIVGGAHDPIIPPDWVRTMAEMMPNARSIIVPNAAHAMNFSASEELSRIIRTAVDA